MTRTQRPTPDAVPRDVRLPVVRDAHTCRGPDDLEGWAQLCPECVGKAGDNGFLRFRLRQALTERGAAAAAGDGRRRRDRRDRVRRRRRPGRARPRTADADRDAEMLAYYEARAPEYDDWYLRRGRYERGPVHDAAWNAELDVAGRWLDALPIRGEIVELAAGHRLVVAAPRLEGRAVALRRRRRRRSIAHASASSRTGCGRTSTCATRGPSPIGRSMPSSPASG